MREPWSRAAAFSKISSSWAPPFFLLAKGAPSPVEGKAPGFHWFFLMGCRTRRRPAHAADESFFLPRIGSTSGRLRKVFFFRPVAHDLFFFCVFAIGTHQTNGPLSAAFLCRYKFRPASVHRTPKEMCAGSAFCEKICRVPAIGGGGGGGFLVIPARFSHPVPTECKIRFIMSSMASPFRAAHDFCRPLLTGKPLFLFAMVFQIKEDRHFH